jgi:hypothetical protein
MALLALYKPNVAGFLLAGIVAVLLFSPYRRQVALLSLGAAFSVFVFLLLLKLDPREILSGYLGIAGRGFTLKQLFQDLPRNEARLFGFLLLLMLIPWARGFSALVANIKNREVQISLVAFAGGLYGFVTNGEAKPVDLPLLFLATAFGPISFLKKGVVSDAKKKLDGVFGVRLWLGFLHLLLGVACAQAVTRHRVELIGPGLFFEYKLSRGECLPEFFHGLRAGENLNQICREVAGLLSTAPGKKIHFGPRMQWAYAAYGAIPPKDQPSWWHPGVSFPAKDEARYLEGWFSQRYDLAMFLKNDFTYLPMDFMEALTSRYSVDQSNPRLTVFRIRPGSQ